MSRNIVDDVPFQQLDRVLLNFDRPARVLLLADFFKRQLAIPDGVVMSVQYGNMVESGFPDENGFTASSPDGTQFMIAISDKVSDELLPEVVLHELLHVLFAHEKEGGEEEIVFLCAKALISAMRRQPFVGRVKEL